MVGDNLRVLIKDNTISTHTKFLILNILLKNQKYLSFKKIVYYKLN